MRSHDAPQVWTNEERERWAWMLSIALLALLIICWYFLQAPWIAVLCVAGAAAIYLLGRLHMAAVPLVTFALYINLPAVAVKFHHIPSSMAKLSLAPLLIPLGYYILWRRDGIVITKTLPWLILFIAIQWTSAIASQRPELALEAVKTSLLEGGVVYALFTNVVRTRDTLYRMISAILVACAIMGTLSAFQQATRTFNKNYGGFAQVAEGDGFQVAVDRGTVYQRRLAGPIGEQNRYAQIMLVVVPLGWAVASLAAGKTEKAVAWIATLLTGLGCLLTFSRGAAVGACLTLIVAASLRLITFRQLSMLAVVGLLIVLAMPQYRTRLASLTRLFGTSWSHADEEAGPDGAVRGRATEMLAAAKMWVDHPILGVGPDLSQLETRAYGMEGGMRALEGNRKTHCLYLEFAAELGILGLVCFLALMSQSVRSLIHIRQQSTEGDPFLHVMSTGFLLAIVGYLTTGLFLHFSYVRYFWLLLAAADSTASLAIERNKDNAMAIP